MTKALQGIGHVAGTHHCMNSRLSSGRALTSLLTSTGCTHTKIDGEAQLVRGVCIAKCKCNGKKLQAGSLSRSAAGEAHLVYVQLVEASLQDLVIVDPLILIDCVEVHLRSKLLNALLL